MAQRVEHCCPAPNAIGQEQGRTNIHRLVLHVWSRVVKATCPEDRRSASWAEGAKPHGGVKAEEESRRASDNEGWLLRSGHPERVSMREGALSPQVKTQEQECSDRVNTITGATGHA